MMTNQTNAEGAAMTANPIEKLRQMLLNHDWTYNYSDDHRAWKKGQEERDAIIKLSKELGLESKVVDCFNAFIEGNLSQVVETL